VEFFKRKTSKLMLCALIILLAIPNLIFASTSETVQKDITVEVNGENVKLHYIKTDPDNIVLKSITAELGDIDSISNYMDGKSYKGAINGGFFNKYTGLVGAIAVNNGTPIDDNADTNYFSTEENGWGGGTLIWDRVNEDFVIRTLKDIEKITSENIVADTSKYWAQGGIAMNLQNDAIWEDVFKGQAPSHYLYDLKRDKSSYRSAMLYDSNDNVYLVVTDGKYSYREVRSAVKKINSDIIDGIFLDGSTCSQMTYDGKDIENYGREVAEAIVVSN